MRGNQEKGKVLVKAVKARVIMGCVNGVTSSSEIKFEGGKALVCRGVPKLSTAASGGCYCSGWQDLSETRRKNLLQSLVLGQPDTVARGFPGMVLAG